MITLFDTHRFIRKTSVFLKHDLMSCSLSHGMISVRYFLANPVRSGYIISCGLMACHRFPSRSIFGWRFFHCIPPFEIYAFGFYRIGQRPTTWDYVVIFGVLFPAGRKYRLGNPNATDYQRGPAQGQIRLKMCIENIPVGYVNQGKIGNCERRSALSIRRSIV